AMVFQSYALYPHMSVAQNIGFPLKMIGTPAAQIAQAVRDAADRVAIAHLLDRKPGQLSGGQQQRCALARAIVRQPRLFLLDEPLSNLDAKLRLETRAELRKLQRSLNVTGVYVTHDQEEAMTIADRMAVFMEGRIVQVGTPHEIFRKPATATVAAFIGTPPMNLLPAVLERGHVRIGDATLPVETGTDGADRAPADVTLGVRPGDLRLAASGIPARVDFVEDFGDSSIVNLDAAGHRGKLRAGELPLVREGENVHLAFDPRAAHLFDRATGNRI
ncbi:MAG: ABC transporter ATP-binding protein, partial [Variovorax sp.]